MSLGTGSCQNSVSPYCPTGHQIDDAMKNYKFTIVITFVAALYWVAESLVHFFIFLDTDSSFIPTDINELWMRSGIVVLMISFGIYADIQTGKLLANEQEKRQIFIATVSSTQHILNNLLNQMQIALVNTGGVNSLDDETRKLLKQAITEGKDQVIRLGSVTKIDEATIRKSIKT